MKYLHKAVHEHIRTVSIGLSRPHPFWSEDGHSLLRSRQLARGLRDEGYAEVHIVELELVDGCTHAMSALGYEGLPPEYGKMSRVHHYVVAVKQESCDPGYVMVDLTFKQFNRHNPPLMMWYEPDLGKVTRG